MSRFYTFINPLILFPLLAAACLVYYLLPARFRWVCLLVFSAAFYVRISSWAALVLLGAILLNYFLGLRVAGSQGKRKTATLIAGILLNLGLLAAFKYGTPSISTLLATDTISAGLIYPLGLSFFTVQNISYLVDVSKKLVPAERNLGVFAAYVSFFPKIASGPIERARNLIPQFWQEHAFDWENITWGVRQVVFGLFKKLVIADRLAIIANEVFDHPLEHHGLSVAAGILCFAFQLYFDFAGYSDLALGIARLFGIKLTVNFRLPYLAEDAVEFWNRWHISFSTWLRDYIFYPSRRYLLKNFRSAVLIAAVIPPLVTMLASGFWHGTGWTFILWGLYHAVLYIFVVLRKQYLGIEPFLQKQWMKYPKIVLNFVFVTLGWIFFRANSIGDIGVVFKQLLQPKWGFVILQDKVGLANIIISGTLIAGAIVFELLLENKIKVFDQISKPVRWAIYCFLLVAISAFGVYQASGNPFVYFRF
ncbi:MAG: MBOAT family O-acyltransferase [Anaerolineaceae bacterium]